MSDTVHTIALAGLLHNIGKFMQRAELEKDFPEIGLGEGHEVTAVTYILNCIDFSGKKKDSF